MFAMVRRPFMSEAVGEVGGIEIDDGVDCPGVLSVVLCLPSPLQAGTEAPGSTSMRFGSSW
jgi:hypothetical protein